MLRTTALLGVGLAIGLAASSDQNALTFAQLSGTSESEIIAAAEREGAAFPVATDLPRRTKAVFTSSETPGTADRRCVTGSGRGPLRSGQFVIGGELSGKDPQDPRKGVAPKIWWSPLHHESKMELLVRARRVETSGEYWFRGVTVAYGSAGPNQEIPVEQREYFFPSGIEFLHSGKWVVIATQGSDWGCFILTMPAPVAD